MLLMEMEVADPEEALMILKHLQRQGFTLTPTGDAGNGWSFEISLPSGKS